MHNPDSRLEIFKDIAKQNDVVVHEKEMMRLITISDDYTDSKSV